MTGGEIAEWLRAAAFPEHHPTMTFDVRAFLLDAADIIDRLHVDNKLLTEGYEHVRGLLDQFSQHCQCEHSSATMFILHRAAMKHDAYSRSKATADE